MTTEVNSNSKWVGRSRQVWAIVSAALFACVGAARELGIELPGGLEVAVDGLVQAIIGSGAAGLALLSLFRPDNAKLTALPSKGNTPMGSTKVLEGASVLGAILLCALVLPNIAYGQALSCDHMCGDWDNQGVVFDVVDGNVAICTPCVTGIGNPLPPDLVMDECVIEIIGGPVYSASGPFNSAQVVHTPIPAVMEFDHGMRVWCSAGGTEGAVLDATARFPFSGPGVPGQPVLAQ